VAKVDKLDPPAKAMLAVHVGERKATPALSFRYVDSEDLPGGSMRRYTFEQTGRTLKVKPGDLVWGELPLKGGRMLAWWDWRAARWSFEGLTRPPLLVDDGAKPGTAGTSQAGAKLRLRGDSPVPKVPDLLPRVRADD
jgi:hypothetical protein